MTLARVQWKVQGVLPGGSRRPDFTVLMVERYFILGGLPKGRPEPSEFGMRWAGSSGRAARDEALRRVQPQLLPEKCAAEAEKIHEMLQMPVMVGEYHFGALDAGCPLRASAI